MSAKLALRNKLKQARLEMGDAERTVKSRQIVERLKADINWAGVKTVHYFEPISEMMEVDISDLVVYLEDNFPDIKLFTTRKIGNEWEMVSRQEGLAPPKFDVVIVPMLGFDKSLNRIGYGGGYYDKFLAGQPEALKVGVCFEQGKVDRIPTETHDLKLDVIITENKKYEVST